MFARFIWEDTSPDNIILLRQLSGPFKNEWGICIFFMHCCCLSEGSFLASLRSVPVVTNSHSGKKRTSLIHHANFQMYSCMLGILHSFTLIWLTSLLLCLAIPMAGLPTRKVGDFTGTPQRRANMMLSRPYHFSLEEQNSKPFTAVSQCEG